MIFVDASAMISMMTGESDADGLADRLGAERLRLCSAISVWETIAGLCRTHTFSVPSARAVVQSFIEFERSQVRRHRRARVRACSPGLCRVRQGAAPGRPQHGRLLCLRLCEGQPGQAAVQGRRFLEDGHRPGLMRRPANGCRSSIGPSTSPPPASRFRAKHRSSDVAVRRSPVRPVRSLSNAERAGRVIRTCSRATHCLTCLLRGLGGPGQSLRLQLPRDRRPSSAPCRRRPSTTASTAGQPRDKGHIAEVADMVSAPSPGSPTEWRHA